MAVDDLTKQVISNEFARFCAKEKAMAGRATAERFAVKVTESGARDFHGLSGKSLVQMLDEEFPNAA
jgi:hypothetical protein